MSNKITFFVFNIKLQTNKSDEERLTAYRDLIQKLTQKKNRIFEIKKNQAIIMYGSLGDSSSPFIYGRSAKGLYVSGEVKNVLKNGEVQKEPNDPDSLIDPNQARYIFIPEAHRLCVEKTSKGPSPSDIEKYLNHFLNKLIDKEDIIEIVLEKDTRAIEEIFNAISVYEISYKISYTNEDLNKDLAKLFDDELKENNIGELTVNAKADNKQEGLKIDKSPILGGGLKLAESNEEIRRAVIIPKNAKKKKTVTNQDIPKLIDLRFKDQDNFWLIWYNKILTLYRKQAN